MQNLEYECPRCSSPAVEAFYGPCRSCRDDLRSTQFGEKRLMHAAEYEPKMNVTPNAVATKDD